MIIMTMNMRNAIIMLGCVMALGLASCKPTESNYKAAYDAAQQKRKAEANDPDILLPAGGLQQIGAPVKRVIDGDSVYITAEHLKVIENQDSEARKWNVAVASYKMRTNCIAQAKELVAQGMKAFVVENVDSKFYVIAGSFDTLKEAAAFSRKYAEGKKESVFVGLPGEPIIIEKR